MDGSLAARGAGDAVAKNNRKRKRGAQHKRSADASASRALGTKRPSSGSTTSNRVSVRPPPLMPPLVATLRWQCCARSWRARRGC